MTTTVAVSKHKLNQALAGEIPLSNVSVVETDIVQEKVHPWFIDSIRTETGEILFVMRKEDWENLSDCTMYRCSESGTETSTINTLLQQGTPLLFAMRHVFKRGKRLVIQSTETGWHTEELWAKELFHERTKKQGEVKFALEKLNTNLQKNYKTMLDFLLNRGHQPYSTYGQHFSGDQSLKILADVLKEFLTAYDPELQRLFVKALEKEAKQYK